MPVGRSLPSAENCSSNHPTAIPRGACGVLSRFRSPSLTFVVAGLDSKQICNLASTFQLNPLASLGVRHDAKAQPFCKFGA